MKINLVTLGCSKNTVDSEKLLHKLSVNGFEISHNSEDYSEVVIINTCGFIADAKMESIETILKFCKAKSSGLIKKIFVIGCLSQRYKDSLKQEIPLIDEYFGVNDQERIIRALGVNMSTNVSASRILTTPNHYAYLKISEGCNRKCAFCSIPLIRGKQVSIPINDLVYEATDLAQKGVKELILIAQDLTAYGTDIYGKKMLINLLGELRLLDGIDWIRLHYMYPENFPYDELIAFMKNEKKICNYIDIPFQHVNDRILRDMTRGYRKADILDFIRSIRSDLPGAATRTTMITGFPGETEKEFMEMYDFVSEIKFERMGVFTYSHEEDTPAWNTYKDSVPDRVKKSRQEKLLELQQNISFERNQTKKGKKYKVLIDGEEGEYYRGRTEYDSPEIDQEVLIPKSTGILKMGEFYHVTITDAMEFDLFGKI